MDETVLHHQSALDASTVKKTPKPKTTSPIGDSNISDLAARKIHFEELLPVCVHTVDDVEQQAKSFNSESVFNTLYSANSQRATVDRKLSAMATGVFFIFLIT